VSASTLPISALPGFCHVRCEVRDDNIYHRHSEVFGATETIEGLDAVGQVVELGPGVTDFHVGQVVLTIGRGIGARELNTLLPKISHSHVST
jgi:hypothetical protein